MHKTASIILLVYVDHEFEVLSDPAVSDSGVQTEPDSAHTHAGVEELHLLDGELWIDERKLFPGDYNYGVPRAGDERVWSETGCTCILITGTKDTLR